MPRATCLVALVAGLAVVSAQAEDRFAKFDKNPTLVAPTDPKTPQEQQKLFRLPEGFEIQLVASEPDIQKPLNLNFDAAGRLWVTMSLEYPYPAKEGSKPRDLLRVLEDTDHDGKADKFTTFADGLNIPIGVTPVNDGVLCHSIPDIFKMVDTDGDGKADTRKVAYGSIGFVDTHGMASSFRWWIDGWVYGCHGFSNTSEVKGSDNQPVKMQSGNTYRMRPDGSHIEYHTHGQVNPFGLCFDPLGNSYSSDCHTKPAYMLLRGAWYPSFGKPHDGLGFGPELVSHLHGSTGIAGIVYYAADHFPANYRDTLFIGNPVTGRVNRDVLEPHGSSYRGIEQPDFLSCEDPWFRPVDLQVAPDGSLYIADFYNKIIGHYEVPLDHPARDRDRGRIWRVVYRGTKEDKKQAPTAVADLTKIAAAELIKHLDHPNLTVRTLATHQLVHRIGPDAANDIGALLKGTSTPWQRVHGLWILHRLDRLDEETVRKLADDPDRAVRVHLVKALAERPQWSASPLDIGQLVLAKLSDPDAFVRRAAADALGRHPRLEHIQPLLELWTKTPADDDHLVHTIRMALRDTLAAQDNLKRIADKLKGRPDDERRIADVSLGIAAPSSARYLLQQAQAGNIDPRQFEAALHHTARYLEPDQLSRLYQTVRILRYADTGSQRSVIRALQQGLQERGEKLAPEVRTWAVELAGSLLASPDEPRARAGLEVVSEVKLTELTGELGKIAAGKGKHSALRPASFETLAALDAGQARGVLLAVLANPEEPAELRQKSAETLGGISNADSLAAMALQLQNAPSQLAIAIARGMAKTQPGAELLLKSAEEGKASPRLLRDGVVELGYRAHNFTDKQPRLDKLLKDLPPEDERLAKLVALRRDGFLKSKFEKARGKEVFEKSCAKCHQIAGAGAKVGPQLDGIGLRGLDRLLEDTLQPNQNVDQAFRSTTLALADGRLISGLVLREEGEVIVLADAEGKEVRISSSEIEERRVSALSPMPADVGAQLAEPDFYSLLGYLLDQKKKSDEAPQQSK